MTPEAPPQPKQQDTSSTNSTATHWQSCCYPAEALCGADLTNDVEVDSPVDCVVCVDLGFTDLSCGQIRAHRRASW